MSPQGTLHFCHLREREAVHDTLPLAGERSAPAVDPRKWTCWIGSLARWMAVSQERGERDLLSHPLELVEFVIGAPGKERENPHSG